jgi:hypothetical protein
MQHANLLGRVGQQPRVARPKYARQSLLPYGLSKERSQKLVLRPCAISEPGSFTRKVGWD